MPTWASILVAFTAATATLGSAGIAAFVSLRRGQQEIHVLVNNRLTEALAEIKRLGGEDKDF